MHNRLEHLIWLLRDRTPIKRTYESLKDRPDGVSPGFAACVGCNAELALRLTTRTLGPDVIMAIPPGCMGGCAPGYGRESGMKVTTVMPLMDNAAAMASGLQRAIERQSKNTRVVVFAGDGATGDIGLQCLSAAAERRENILYVCYDNEGYMNTGVQRSGTTSTGTQTTTTPVGKAKRGKPEAPKDVPMVVLASNAAYVATASTAFPADFAHKLRKAANVTNGLAYLHLFSPCPVGWHFPPEKTIEIGRMAVETRFFSLWEAVEGRVRLTRTVYSPRPLDDYLTLIGKYSHLSPAERQALQVQADERWARLKRLLG